MDACGMHCSPGSKQMAASIDMYKGKQGRLTPEKNADRIAMSTKANVNMTAQSRLAPLPWRYYIMNFHTQKFSDSSNGGSDEQLYCRIFSRLVAPDKHSCSLNPSTCPYQVGC